MGTGAKVKDTTHVEVATLAALLLVPAGKRKWGMLVTVYADPTAINNRTFQLVYNQSSTAKTDNSNWVDVTTNIATLVTSKTRRTEFAIAEHSNVTQGINTILTSDQIADGEAVTIFTKWVGVASDASNKGCGGLTISTWTKEAGVLHKVADTPVVLHNDMGFGAITLVTSDVGGNIRLTIGATVSNFSYTGTVECLFRKIT